MTVAYAPDALHTLRDSFALHLDASRTPSTRRIYLNALDRLIGHLEAHGMSTAARSVKREHVESFVAARLGAVRPTTMSVEFRPLQQFWKWAGDEDEVDRSPMDRMKAPTVPQLPESLRRSSSRLRPFSTGRDRIPTVAVSIHAAHVSWRGSYVKPWRVPKMQPDLTRPGAAEQLETTVSLVVEASSKDDAETMYRAGQAFGRLHELVGGDRDTLRQHVFDVAADTVRHALGIPRAS